MNEKTKQKNLQKPIKYRVISEDKDYGVVADETFTTSRKNALQDVVAILSEDPHFVLDDDYRAEITISPKRKKFTIRLTNVPKNKKVR